MEYNVCACQDDRTARMRGKMVNVIGKCWISLNCCSSATVVDLLLDDKWFTGHVLLATYSLSQVGIRNILEENNRYKIGVCTSIKGRIKHISAVKIEERMSHYAMGYQK